MWIYLAELMWKKHLLNFKLNDAGEIDWKAKYVRECQCAKQGVLGNTKKHINWRFICFPVKYLPTQSIVGCLIKLAQPNNNQKPWIFNLAFVIQKKPGAHKGAHAYQQRKETGRREEGRRGKGKGEKSVQHKIIQSISGNGNNENKQNCYMQRFG